jgi:hypothetical protein
VNHLLTKEKNRQLLNYTNDGEKTFRDCNSERLGGRLGYMMIELYVVIEKREQARGQSHEPALVFVHFGAAGAPVAEAGSRFHRA